MTNKRIFTVCFLFVLALSTQWLARPEAVPNSPSPSATTEPAPDGLTRVTKVVDGDTIEIEGGAHVRYIGVNTPETVHPTKPVECFGKEASDYNKTLLEGGLIRLERDISDTDKYGRLLRYIYLPDGTFVNLKMVTGGYAYADTYPPDIAHAKEFVTAQSAARASRQGLWASCPVKK